MVNTHRFKTRITFIVLTCLLMLFSGGTTAQAQDGAAWQKKIAPGVSRQMTDQSQADILVIFGQKADLTGAEEMGWLERGRFVHERLLAAAESAQAGVAALLNTRPDTYRSYRRHIVINAISIKGLVDTGMLNTLAQFTQVSDITGLKEESLIVPVESAAADRDFSGPTWGVKDIGATDLWNQGITGQGIVVGSIDSGVRYTHETLVNQYRGNLGGGRFSHDYNWWDPSGRTLAPEDSDPDYSHGTHTTGTSVGGDGTHRIGVAPGAKWIACIGCQGRGCQDDDLLACGDFMLAPWALDGQGPADGNPDMRPQVINNSWGGDNCTDTFVQMIDHWRAAGIFPSMSAGNAGPDCRTTGMPGGYENTVATGAYDAFGNIAWFSSRGPSCRGTNIKPEVSAPGVSVLSANGADDQAYKYLGGTSMAAPHTTGMVALLWSARPELVGDVDQTTLLLEQGARPVVDMTCDRAMTNAAVAGIPNNTWGYGKIDAVRTLAASTAGTALLPGFQRRIGRNGQSFEYPFTLTNGADHPVSFDLSLSAYVWDAALSADQVMVPAHGETAFTVTHRVPDQPFTDEESITVQAAWSGGVLSAQFSSKTTTGSTCSCPKERKELFSESFEGAFPPAGWEVRDNDANSLNGWQRNDALPNENNNTGGSGYCAEASSRDWYYPMDTELRTPVIDLTSLPEGQSVRLEFKTRAMVSWDQTEHFLVETSIDQGVSWTTAVELTDDRYASMETVDLIDVAGKNLMIRFHYWSENQNYYWQVDDVTIYTCQDPETGQVICPVTEVACPGVNALQARLYNFSPTAEKFLLTYEASDGVLAGPSKVGPVASKGSAAFDLNISLPYDLAGQSVQDNIIATGVQTGSTTVGRVTCQSGGWVQGAAMPFTTYNSAAVAYQDKIYLIGAHSTAGQVAIYNPATNDWTTGPTLDYPAIEAPSCGIFGYDDQSRATVTIFPDNYSARYLNTFNLDTETWSTPSPPADMYFLKNSGRMCVSDPDNNVGYLLGGFGSAVYRYHPDTNTVDTLADLPDNRINGAAWLYDGKLCVAGGQVIDLDSSTVAVGSTYCLDLTSNTWGQENADLPALPFTWWGMTYSTYQGAPMIQGGRAGTHETPATLRYSPEDGQWETLAPAVKPVREAAGVVFNDRYYVFGGGLPDRGTFDYTQILMDCSRTPDEVTLSGQIYAAGRALAGVKIDGLPQTIYTDGEGRFEVQVPYGWTGTITPVLDRLRFSPAQRTFDHLDYEAVAQDFTVQSGNSGGGGGCFIGSASDDHLD